MLSMPTTAESSSQLADALNAVLEPITSAHGLPNEVYTDPAWLRTEREKLFAAGWVALGFASDVPTPGDVRPIQWLGWPLILLRDRQDRIRVFHNVCSHRGQQLVAEPCHVNAGLRCPYHSWHYGLDGQLKGTPHIGGANCHGCDAFDKSSHGLSEVSAEVWCDVVFINLSGKGPPFADFLAPVMRRWENFWGASVPEQLVPGGADSQLVLEVAANWKLAVENYCESYHLPMVHPALNSYSRLEDHYIVSDEQDESFSGQGTRAYNLAATADIRLPAIPQWPDARRREAEYIALYPNVLLGIQADHFFAVLLEPLSEQRTREHLRLYYVGDAATAPEYADARAAQRDAWETVFTEDVAMVEGMQRGRASPAYAGGVFSPVQDIATHHFHRWAARRLLPTVESEDQVELTGANASAAATAS